MPAPLGCEQPPGHGVPAPPPQHHEPFRGPTRKRPAAAPAPRGPHPGAGGPGPAHQRPRAQVQPCQVLAPGTGPRPVPPQELNLPLTKTQNLSPERCTGVHPVAHARVPMVFWGLFRREASLVPVETTHPYISRESLAAIPLPCRPSSLLLPCLHSSSGPTTTPPGTVQQQAPAVAPARHSQGTPVARPNQPPGALRGQKRLR